MEGFMDRLLGAMQGDGWQERVEGIWREMTGRREFAGVPQEERNNLLEQVCLSVLQSYRLESELMVLAPCNGRSHGCCWRYPTRRW